MPNVGKLIVDLEANTATFTGPLANAEKLARGNAKGIQDAFNGMEFGSARGGMMVMDELIGIHIPRHVTALIAQMPILGAAMELAFPLLAVLAIGKAIFELVEKTQKHTEEVEKNKEKILDLISTTRQHTDTLEISRLKIQDHIRALEGQPAQNGAKIAILEAKKAADELAHSIQKDIDKEAELFATQKQNLLAQLFITHRNLSQDMIMGYTDYAEKRRKLTQDIELTEDAATKDRLTASRKELDTRWSERVDFERKKTDLALSSGKMDIFNPATGGTFKDVQIHRGSDNEKDLRDKQDVLGKMALMSRAEVEREAAQDAYAAEDKKAKALEALHNNIDNLDKEWAETKKVSDAKTKEAIAFYEVQFQQGKISAERLIQLKQGALDKQYAVEMAHLEKVKKLEAGHSDLQKKIQSEETALKTAHNVQILNDYVKTMEAQKKLLEALYKWEEGQKVKQEAEAKKESDKAVALAAQKNKALLADLALIQGEGNRNIAQIDKEIANLNRLSDQYKLTGDAAKNVQAAIHQLSLQRQHDIDEEARRSGVLGAVMRATMHEMIQDGQQWKIKVADEFKRSVGEMNNALGNFAMTGKMDLHSLVQNAVQGFIMMALQYEESQLMMYAVKHLGKAKDAASTAGTMTALGLQANALAMATIPPPAGEAVGASLEGIIAGMTGMASGAMLMNRGGVVPGTGNGDIVPAMLTPGERVLTRDENRAFTGNATSAKSDGGPKSIVINPTVHVPPGGSAKEFERFMENAVDRALRSHARRRGLGLD